MTAALDLRSQIPDVRVHGLPAARSLAGNLAARLSGKRPSAALVGAVNAALALLADHELAASTVAIRMAAAVRSPVYGCIAAGLGVLQGPLHGGTSLRVEDLLAQIGPPPWPTLSSAPTCRAATRYGVPAIRSTRMATRVRQHC